ncbi:hypothetical protein AJ78_03062 [Emergomyces pasteurianus Ep9510]|uniref:Uncharacterized protein n=1 Tax=Emergomyces pasteurianus Ep9510 TaxID=1447872 RepID=A0A1J9Q999_9EURO|nr:hypothetical protein AJ78_03062 [Emergomyces pasteurianus Ep9510]
MKLSALITSTLVLSAFASPIVEVTQNVNNKHFRQLSLTSPLNWQPGPSLLSEKPPGYSASASDYTLDRWVKFLKDTCAKRLPDCVSFAGYLAYLPPFI